MPEMILISGPPGTGKSTIARALGERRHLCAVLERDSFYGFFTAGFIPPWLPEAASQNHVSVRACTSAARAYLDYCDVVLVGVFDPSEVGLVLAELQPTSVPVHLVRLMAKRHVAIARALSRSRNLRLAISEERYGQMFDRYLEHGPFAGVELDTTALTAEATTARVEFLINSQAALLAMPTN